MVSPAIISPGEAALLKTSASGRSDGGSVFVSEAAATFRGMGRRGTRRTLPAINHTRNATGHPAPLTVRHQRDLAASSACNNICRQSDKCNGGVVALNDLYRNLSPNRSLDSQIRAHSFAVPHLITACADAQRPVTWMRADAV